MSIEFASRSHGTDGAADYNGPVQTHSYDYDTGLVPVPVAGPPDEDGNPITRVVKVHSGFGTRRVDWSVGRSNRPPIIPAMVNEDDPDSNDLLISGTVAPDLPQPDVKRGGWIWSVRGSYEYLQRVPRIAGKDTLPTGKFPYPIEPQVTLAALIGQSTLGGTTATTFDAAIEQLGSNLVDHATDSYAWPYTALPAICSTDDAFN